METKEDVVQIVFRRKVSMFLQGFEEISLDEGLLELRLYSHQVI